MAIDLRERAEFNHRAVFYDSDDHLAMVMVEQFGEQIAAGDAVLLIATADHRQRVLASLADAGFGLEGAMADSRLVLHDAAATLERLVVGGSVDEALFRAVIPPMIRDLAASGRRVHIYGEMVALLWGAGDVTGAMELERLWNGIAEAEEFSLLCGYPAGAFADRLTAEGFSGVCDHHSQVIDGAPTPRDVEAWRRFPRSEATPRLARDFVREQLWAWQLEHLGDDAVLVVSELATNAVTHARSDVSVALERQGSGVRVVVGDASSSVPGAREPDRDRPGGRGLSMVDVLADAWGYELVGGGKLLWAHLGIAEPRS